MPADFDPAAGFADPPAGNADAAQTLRAAELSLTRALERWSGAPVVLEVLSQATGPAGSAPLLRLEPGEPWLEREVLLCGQRGAPVYAHAKSQIALVRLPRAFRRRLLAARGPMGRFWDLLSGEIHKEMLRVFFTPVGGLARHFHLPAGARALYRCYRVDLRGCPVMVIQETIPCGAGPLE